MRDNYAPSSAPLVAAQTQRPRSSLVAVLLGGIVVDVIGSILLNGVLVSALVALSVGDGTTDIETLTHSLSFAIVATVGGMLPVGAGGYAAAWWARRRPIAHALGAGAVSLPFALLGHWLQPDTSMLWFAVASLAFHLPLAALGGYVWARTQPAA